MKITIITSPFGYIPPNGIGAIEKLWYDLALSFKKKGCDVTVVSKYPGACESSKNDINRIYVNGYKRGKTIYEDLFFDLLYSIKCFFKIQKTDVLVMNTFWMPLLCGLFKCKYLLSVYNIARYPKGQFKLYSRIDYFFSVSRAIEKEFKRQLPKRSTDIKTINNPIKTDVFTWRKKDPATKITIMYHGRIHPEKGLDILVSSLRQLRMKYDNLELILVGTRDIANGGGGDKYVKRLEELASGAIKWVNPISDPSDLADMISSCDIYCYPSVAEKGETFGVSPLEAMGLGRPVIVSSLDCFKDFIEDGVNGFVFDHRSTRAVDELSVRLEQLINDPALREKIGWKAFESSREFSNENIAGQYLAEFERLLKKHG
nr:glycosyltransferase family 4 protein [Parabacteroides goldsteinii]